MQLQKELGYDEFVDEIEFLNRVGDALWR
jgi:hypothetical protein